MRISLLIAAALVLGTVSGWARLGETEVQCIERYGSPVKIVEAGQQNLPYRTVYFVKNGYNIGASFLNAKCAVLVVSKVGSDEMTDDELQVLLTANSGGKQWTKSTEMSMDQNWNLSDGAQALYSTMDHTLIFISKDGVTDAAARHKAETAKSLKDF